MVCACYAHRWERLNFWTSRRPSASQIWSEVMGRFSSSGTEGTGGPEQSSCIDRDLATTRGATLRGRINAALIILKCRTCFTVFTLPEHQHLLSFTAVYYFFKPKFIGKAQKENIPKGPFPLLWEEVNLNLASIFIKSRLYNLQFNTIVLILHLK